MLNSTQLITDPVLPQSMHLSQ